ncbi:small multi-drug export protein [Pontibacter qinzhouensis]|uniref:Small multi-drug export protein n=1 Tax=Pontibacter qinzhouensis TaxID=2603253 RepID=A0A5C8KEL8_9BACT|nr:small multi-drug export protein [Pontibacter qinzhouensis]TXK52087.1 small multi-drug export protein [Pontibacter qinzhouensis]
MFEVLFFTFLLSISPLGEARAGIPYAILNDVHIGWAFLIGLIANLLIYPLFMWLIDTFNKKLWPNRVYRKSVVKLSKRAKNGVGADNQKYGFWGLMIFVMIPLPGTGAYMGTIAANVLKIERKKAFLAISLGVVSSCVIMAAAMYLGAKGIQLL